MKNDPRSTSHDLRILLLALAVTFLLPTCATSSGPPDAPAATVEDPAAEIARPEGFRYPDHDTLRVATWNAEHFVDAHDNPYIDNDREDDPPAGMAERRDRFVQAVRRLDADVLVLQEFESDAYAEHLAEERFPKMGYEFFAGTESRDWYMNVVLMSRVPLGVVESYASVTTPIVGQTHEGESAAQHFTNNRMWTADVLARPGYTFTLAGLHLKAGPDARDAAWRTGQIRFLRRQLSDLLKARPRANILVAGDLNSLPASPELQLLLNGEDGDASSLRLINPLAGRETLTHPAEDPARQLDYLLVNEHMRPELVDGSVRVASPLPQGAQAQTSDHLPVTATILAQEHQPTDRTGASTGAE